jgi:hypothetical protein
MSKSEIVGFNHPRAIKNQIDTLQIKEFGKGYFIVLKEGKEILWRRIK